ncbi:MAG: hypothetical protein EKK69_03520 [Candidatus Competibacteraceae bacterium]|nr:MAG: hypothetical protein EKK69_03520 [Candidatus Competibacteraceae bacterium]
MLTKFKKFGVAAAVAAALGASGAAQAVIQGEPGDALLVPYVITTGSGKINTMVGIISASPDKVAVDQLQFPTLTASAKTSTSCAGKLHWYFFDIKSVEIVDGTLPVTCEDFVPFDFAAITANLPSAQNTPGYLVITDNDASPTVPSGKILYAAAYQIRGNWATQAYIPVLPMIDDVDDDDRDEVEHNGAFVSDVNPVTAGMELPVNTGDAGLFSLRYYLGANPVGSTDFVLWFPENSDARKTQGILVYDGNEVAFSARTSIPNELNILQVSPTATGKGIYTGTIVDGLADTGFVLFNLKDGYTSTTTPNQSRGGFAFSLVGVAGSTQEQIQTELAQERGVITPPTGN